MNKNNNFLVGLTKLEQNILNNIQETAKTGATVPFIHIPEELDPVFGITLSSDLGNVYNTPNIFDGILSYIAGNTDFTDEKSELKALFDKEMKNNDNTLSRTLVNFAQNTYNLLDMALTAEFHKEISDAYYLIMYHLAKDITNSIANSDECAIQFDSEIVRHKLLEVLIDEEFINKYLIVIIQECKLYKEIPDDYTRYNYSFLFRHRVITNISSTTYDCVKNLLYCYDITPNEVGDLFDLCYNRLVFNYMYTFDNMLYILCMAFQQKIHSCYKDIGKIIDAIEEDESGNEE